MGAAAGVQRAARARPKITTHQAVLNALTQPAFGTMVEVKPITGRELLDILVVPFTSVRGISGSGWVRAGICSCGRRLDQATGHIRVVRSVAYFFAPSVCQVPADVVTAVVEVERQPFGRIQLNSTQGGETMQRRDRAVRSQGDVSDGRRTIAPHPVAIKIPFR